MRIPKVYLETTLFNYYFDADRDGHIDTVRMFEAIAAGKYEGYTSGYAIAELGNAPEPKRNGMMALLDKHGIIVLSITEESDQLADIYIRNGVFSERYRLDSSHVAIASIHGLDFLLSFNFGHINKIKTKRMTARINKEEGYQEVTICTPMEVLDYEETEHN